VVCTIALTFLYVMDSGPSQISAIYNDLPKYGERIGDIVETIRQRIQSAEDRTLQLVVPARQRQQQEAERLRLQQQAQQSKRNRKQEPVVPPPTGPAAIPEVRIHEDSTPIGDYIAARLGSFYQILLMVSFVPFLVYFMLSWRDHINRSFLQFFHGEDRLTRRAAWEDRGDGAGFRGGQLPARTAAGADQLARILDDALPYPLLVGPLSGFMSLIPYGDAAGDAPAAARRSAQRVSRLTCWWC
jgi:predicted PurR-regulated permease PerM